MSFKEGQVVHRIGIVTDVFEGQISDYTVVVKFPEGDATFTPDGKYSNGSTEPSLFPYNPDEVQELKNEVERLKILLATEQRCSVKEFIDSTPNSILLEAESIVNGARHADYGGTEGIERIAKVASIITNKDLTPKDIALVMISLKLVRESFNHKRDNLVDICGYSEILNKLN